MEFGKKVQFLRKENRMSQEKLAERINVSRQAVSKWEQGITVPDTDNIVQLSKFFQVPIEYLLFDEYDSAEKARFTPKQETRPASDKMKPIVLIIIGIAWEILSVCLSYVIQYYDMDQNGCSYTNALEYLRHLPLSLIVIIGVICVAVGSYGLVKKNKKKVSSITISKSGML